MVYHHYPSQQTLVVLMTVFEAVLGPSSNCLNMNRGLGTLGLALLSNQTPGSSFETAIIIKVPIRFPQLGGVIFFTLQKKGGKEL